MRCLTVLIFLLMACGLAVMPTSGQVVFEQAIFAADKDTISWTTPADVDFVRGFLLALDSYPIMECGYLANATDLDISNDVPAPGFGLYYIIKYANPLEASWQTVVGAQPDRDLEIHDPCSLVDPSSEEIDAAVDGAVVGLSNPWQNYNEFVAFADGMQDGLVCAFEAHPDDGSLMAVRDIASCYYTYCSEVNYCGPGNQMSGITAATGDCINQSCFDHDLCYSSNCVGLQCAFTWQSDEFADCDIALVQGCNFCEPPPQPGLWVTDRAICRLIALYLADSFPPPGACSNPPCLGQLCDEQSGECVTTTANTVPKTGQTGCWDASGTLIDCTGTGQDGEYQAGSSADPRFTDNGDGTVTDNLTNLIWLKEVNCFGFPTWSIALAAANTLADGACGLADGSAAGDWRLPNIKELQSLMDYSQYFPALPDGHPFEVTQVHSYWSSTSVLYEGPHLVWAINLDYGDLHSKSKNQISSAWPVRGGLTDSRVPKTGQTGCWDVSGALIDCTGAGQDGEYQAGISTNPRFIDNSDGTVTDAMTDLIWLKQADCFYRRNWTDALSAVNNLEDGVCSLADGSVAGDWRLPNVNELHSLIDYGQYLPALPPGHPFTVPMVGMYWSSTTHRFVPEDAWYLSLATSALSYIFKLDTKVPWAVRGGL